MNSSHRRRALALIRLDNPSEVVKKVSRTQQKYDVTAAEWNPTQSQGHTFVLAVSGRAYQQKDGYSLIRDCYLLSAL